MDIDYSKNAKTNDPLTSYEAAERAGEIAERQYQQILKVLKRHRSGLLYCEIAEISGMEKNAPARRLPEMEKIGTVCRTGETRKTKSGRNAMIWKLKGERQ